MYGKRYTNYTLISFVVWAEEASENPRRNYNNKMVVVTHDPFPILEKERTQNVPSTIDYDEGSNVDHNSHSTVNHSSSYVFPYDIRDVNTGLDLLKVAVSSRDIVLVKKCIESLDSLLNDQNVLKIYSALGDVEKTKVENFHPSAPPISEQNDDSNNLIISQLISNLRHNCLLEIDKNADNVLQNKDILGLSYTDILAILERDTLQVTSEALVYITVYKWASAECKRRSERYDMKDITQNLSFVPRYGLMSKNEFMGRSIQGIDGPRFSEILDEREWRYIKFYLKEKGRGRSVIPLNHKMSTPRVLGNLKPIELSSRCKNARNMNYNNFRKRTSNSSDCSRKTLFEKCILSVFTCWSFIFD